ncbi:hypothetical protein TSMEX_005196 [Taenia solium]|eukprot:TsM_000942900 transcript=TsM_000942900 gene=TsM_000942900
MATHGSGIDQCCVMIARPVIDQREQSLAREVVHLDQKSGEDDEEHAVNLQPLADRAFRGTPPNRVTNWAAARLCAGVWPSIIVAKVHVMKTNALIQLVRVVTGRRREPRPTSTLDSFMLCPKTR